MFWYITCVKKVPHFQHTVCNNFFCIWPNPNINHNILIGLEFLSHLRKVEGFVSTIYVWISGAYLIYITRIFEIFSNLLKFLNTFLL